MGRKSRRVLGTRTYHNYSDEQLQRALESINNGRSLRDVSRQYGIPISSLSRKRRGLFNNKYGGQNVLSANEEKHLVEGITTAGIWGFPLTKYDIKLIVKNYLDKKGVREKRFKNNTPGRRWIERFLSEHQNVLSQRNAENIKRSRAEVSEQVIKSYFSELEESLQNVPPSHIINYDETNFTDDPGKKRVIVKRGAKHPERCVDSSKSSVSVMMAGTAEGVLLPPYVVYKSEHLYDTWKGHGPQGARYNRSRSGWFDTRLFEDWFFSIIIPFIRNLDEAPKLIIGDNLSSHLSLSVIAECKKHNIRFVLLPPNSTHLCQPLDVSFFHPLKVSWRKQLDIWKTKNRGCVPKDQFPSLLRQTLVNLKDAKQNLISGFTACGIFPFDPTQVLKRLPSWSKTTQEDAQNMNSSLVDLLEQMRHPPDKKTQTRRKKRLAVPPGKSITEEEIGEDNMEVVEDDCPDDEEVLTIQETDKENLEVNIEQPSTSKTGRKTKNKKRKRKYSFSDSSSEQSMHCSVHDSSSDYETLEDVCKEHYAQNFDETDTTFAVNDFLLVEFKPKSKKGSSKYYVGQILEFIRSDFGVQYYCKFMRKFVGPKTPENTFVFPTVEDLSMVDSSMVMAKLDPPKILRGHHTFKISGYTNIL